MRPGQLWGQARTMGIVCQCKNTFHLFFLQFTLRTLQMYLVRISVVRHEKGHTTSVVHFPLETTAFIAVTAYHNRRVTDLKIKSNPYSKAFRNPVKRYGTQSYVLYCFAQLNILNSISILIIMNNKSFWQVVTRLAKFIVHKMNIVNRGAQQSLPGSIRLYQILSKRLQTLPQNFHPVRSAPLEKKCSI